MCVCKKERKVLPFAKPWMKLEGIQLGETDQIEKNKHCVISLICRIFKRQTQRQSRVGCYQGLGTGVVVGQGRCGIGANGGTGHCK